MNKRDLTKLLKENLYLDIYLLGIDSLENDIFTLKSSKPDVDLMLFDKKFELKDGTVVFQGTNVFLSDYLSAADDFESAKDLYEKRVASFEKYAEFQNREVRKWFADRPTSESPMPEVSARLHANKPPMYVVFSALLTAFSYTILVGTSLDDIIPMTVIPISLFMLWWTFGGNLKLGR